MFVLFLLVFGNKGKTKGPRKNKNQKQCITNQVIRRRSRFTSAFCSFFHLVWQRARMTSNSRAIGISFDAVRDKNQSV